MLEQYGIAEVLELACDTALKVVGIGSVDTEPSVVANIMVERPELDTVVKAGGRGELLGHFFSDNGEMVKTELSERTIGLSSEQLIDQNFVAVAGGESKVHAINAILNSRLLSGLITDERTARALVNLEENRC